MKLLIACIAFQDPFYKRDRGRVDYSRGAYWQNDVWKDFRRSAIASAAQQKPLTDEMEYGPLLSGMAAMIQGKPMGSPFEEHSLWGPWVPDEVMLVYQDDMTSLGEPGPIRQRVDETAVFLEQNGIKATRLDIDESVFDHQACWAWMEGHLLPVLTSGHEEPLDTRILIGNATMALRLALFHLGVLTRKHGSQIWLSVDQKLAGETMPAARPLIHGDGLLPELVPAKELEARVTEVERLKQEIAELKMGGGSSGGEIVYVGDSKRVKAQSVLNQLVEEREAPIWNAEGSLHMGRMREELAKRLAQAGIEGDPDTLRRWFTHGRLPEEQRAKKSLYLILDERVRRPES